MQPSGRRAATRAGRTDLHRSASAYSSSVTSRSAGHQAQPQAQETAVKTQNGGPSGGSGGGARTGALPEGLCQPAGKPVLAQEEVRAVQAFLERLRHPETDCVMPPSTRGETTRDAGGAEAKEGRQAHLARAEAVVARVSLPLRSGDLRADGRGGLRSGRGGGHWMRTSKNERPDGAARTRSTEPLRSSTVAKHVSVSRGEKGV